MARPGVLRALVLGCWLASVHADCGVTPAQIDFTGTNVSPIMLDALGAETNWPFPGGSVRWTNVGTAQLEDEGVVIYQAYDLLVIEQEDSSRVYTQPGGQTAAASLSGGFGCLNVGIQSSSCTNGGAYDLTWTPAQPLSEACSAGDLQTGGTSAMPLLPIARVMRPSSERPRPHPSMPPPLSSPCGRAVSSGSADRLLPSLQLLHLSCTTGAQFTFRLVKSGTTQLMPAFDLVQVWTLLLLPQPNGVRGQRSLHGASRTAQPLSTPSNQPSQLRGCPHHQRLRGVSPPPWDLTATHRSPDGVL